VVVGLLLMLLSIFGTENTESLQNAVVGFLLAILVVFLSVSGLDVLGVRGTPRASGAFAPRGFAPILSTAALVFTSFLGFAQIATVAEDIIEPDRTLPLSMVGSVVLVGFFYIATLLIAGYTFEPEVIGQMGETAVVELAREYLGFAGAVVILVGGLLATISSANASILSASRALYGLSSDALVPEAAATVNRTYGTPHFALSFVGGVTVLLVATGRTEVLAEVASFLHLIMYGLICVVLVTIRRRNPAWYDPAFECPGYPAVPIVGGVASFALIGFMQPLSQILGVVLALVAAAWYLLYAGDVELKDKI
jgi:Amino acid transporters